MENVKPMPEGKIKTEVSIRNDVLDEICEIECATQKARVVVQTIKNDYTGLRESKTVLDTWSWERTRVCDLVEIIDDYVYRSLDLLQKLAERLNVENEEEKKVENQGV